MVNPITRISVLGRSMMKKITPQLRQKVEAAGQGHLLSFYDKGELTANEESELASQLEELDFERVANFLKASLEAEKSLKEHKVTPIPQKSIVTVEQAKAERTKLTKLGLELVAKGKVAVLVLAGGQGTRLGFDGPKGCYDFGLPSKKTLFQLQAERLKKLQELASKEFPNTNPSDAVIPYFVMTSPLNHGATTKYFEEKNCFGLKRDDVHFFQQGTLPCLTEEGKVILETKSTVATAPDGNGGVYSALEASGALASMKERGIKWVMACSVDNALIKVADPLFLGLCEDRNCQVGNKSCEKTAWNEKVGVVGMKDGKYNVVEYSEITDEMAQSRDVDGKLLFRAGNICIHSFTVDFITEILPKLSKSYHIARKKIPAVNDLGVTEKPAASNGLKLEMFIFDVFPLAEGFINLECERESNFAPVKNAPGSPSDSPDSARKMLSLRNKRWLEVAGAKVSNQADGSELLCEITPSVSFDGEGLKEFEGLEINTPCIIMSKSDTNDVHIEKLKIGENLMSKVKHYVRKDGLHIYLVC